MRSFGLDLELRENPEAEEASRDYDWHNGCTNKG